MNKKHVLAILAMPLALSTAFAQEAPTVKVSGFGTGALTWSNSDDGEFGRPNQSSGARSKPRTGVDSNLGLQVDAGINDWLSATAQGLVNRDAEVEYGAELTLGFVKAKINDEISVRVGRTGLPTFMISDYRNVGYANTFLRPPQEVYSQMPYSILDGIDATWQHSFGDTTVSLQVGVGTSETKLSFDMHSPAKKTRALNLVAEHGPFTVRAGRVTSDITVTGSTGLEVLVSSLRGAGQQLRMPQLTAIGDALEGKDKPASFTSVGLSMDWNNIVLQTEMAKRKTESYVNDTSSWYVMGGYRFGKVLPYFIHSKLSIDGNPAYDVPAACPAGYPAACNATMRVLRGYAERVVDSGVGQGEQSTTSLGVRWDFHNSLALKVQFDRVKPEAGSGLLISPKPGQARSFTAGSVALDFVF